MSFVVALIANLFVGIVDEIKIGREAAKNKQRFEQDETRKQIKQIQADRDAKIEEINARYRKQDAEFWERYNKIGK